jgi:hypothetical protein
MMEELIKYYDKVKILCKVDIKTIKYVEYDDLYDYYIHKLLVLWNRYQVKHKENYTFEKLYNADKQFWKYNYLNSSKVRHEIYEEDIIDKLDFKNPIVIYNKSYNPQHEIDTKIYLNELIEKAHLNQQELKCIKLFLKGYTIGEINNILGKKVWINVKSKMKGVESYESIRKKIL